MIKIECPLCASEELMERFDSVTDNLRTEGYRVFRCSNVKCGASFRFKLERTILDINFEISFKL